MDGIVQYGEFAVSALEETMHEGFLERIFSVTDSKVCVHWCLSVCLSVTATMHEGFL